MSSEKAVPVLQHWIIDKEKEWEKIKRQGDNGEIYAFFSSIVDYASSLDDPKKVEECLTLLETCHKQIDDSGNPFLALCGLVSLGMDAYSNGVFSVAEIVFRVLSDSGDFDGRNNYAYMMRRGEVSNPMINSPLKALYLLREGIKESEPFAFVNAALTFALCFGSDDDWRLADELMKKMPETTTLSIRSWWSDVAHNGDIEGFLVHYFLVRHGKIEKSELGTSETMSKQISSKVSTFPDWLKTEPRFQSLSDVFETFLKDNFEESLVTYLDEMPRERASAEEILQEIDRWDEWILYNVLLQDFGSFMTRKEIDRVITNYKKKFSVPLPSISGLDIEEDAGTDLTQED